MPNHFYGLPLHPLVVHATVVMIPLAAVAVLFAALWPRFRVWAGPMPAVLSLIGLILVPLSTSTGETLERHVPHSALLEKHTRLADGLLPWVSALLVISLISYAIHRRSSSGHIPRHTVRVVVATLAVVAVAGTTVQVALIGHSGAKAAWKDTDMSSSASR